MKLNIYKAYDKVDWRFMCKILEAFGFSHQWTSLIFKCVLILKISILINGTLEGFFNISRGIRHGDAISPFLFIIMVKSFGREIKKAEVENKIEGVSITHGISNIRYQ